MLSLPNQETACGIFTVAHFLSLALCIVVIICALYITRDINLTSIRRITKIMAVSLAILEILKIVFKLVIKDYSSPDHIIPLYYCTLFIVATLLSGFCGGRVQKLGDCFICGGSILGGIVYLIIPVTSFMDYPVYHFLSIHSMLFHSSMIFLGILYLRFGICKPDFKGYQGYLLFTGSFLLFSLIINLAFKQNFMLISVPVNFPIDFINNLARELPSLYTALAIIAYLTLPYLTAKLFYPLITIKNKHR